MNQPAKNYKTKKILASLLAIGFSLVIVLLRDQIIAFKQYGYLGVFLVSTFGNAIMFLPAPVLMTVVAVGTSLNPILVGIIAAVGAAIGESTGYLVGLGGNVLVSQNKKYHQVKNMLDRYGPLGIFFIAAIPNPMIDLAGILAGTMGIPYPHYFLAVMFGAFIKYTLSSSLGFGIGQFF